VIAVERYTSSPRPVIHLGVDFGAGYLVIGCCGPEGREVRILEFPGWSQEMPGTGAGVSIHGIPALIHYRNDGTAMIGDEVVRAGRADHPATARWIRNYLLEESPVQIPAGAGRRCTFREAAADLLITVLSRAVRECPGTVSAHFSLPPDAPAWYAGWLGNCARTAGCESWHMVDECTALMAGYGLSGDGGPFLAIRFDDTALEVSVILMDGAPEHSPAGELRVTGMARDDTGCRTVDRWIAQEIQAGCGPKYAGTKGQRIFDAILLRLGEVYGQLAAADEAGLGITGLLPGETRSARVSRADIARYLAGHGLPAILDRTIGRAHAAAYTCGCNKPPVAVLMTGRGCAIPAVQELIQERLPEVPVLCDHPFDAIARGAALFLPRMTRPDRIVNDYALRYWDAAAREHRYRFLVRSGARYPSAGQVARITISAAYDGQSRLGIPLYEISTAPGARPPALELVSDPAGGVRLAGPAEDAGAEVRPVLANGRAPTLLVADPPALKGEPRFELTFSLDHEKQLCVTARDLMTGALVKQAAPVHRLT
jgi:molecular chaperone DnaK